MLAKTFVSNYTPYNKNKFSNVAHSAIYWRSKSGDTCCTTLIYHSQVQLFCALWRRLQGFLLHFLYVINYESHHIGESICLFVYDEGQPYIESVFVFMCLCPFAVISQAKQMELAFKRFFLWSNAEFAEVEFLL